MQFTTAIAALLLAAPALISAAPVAPSEAVSLITPVEAHDEIFARVVRCVPRKAKDADDQKKIDAALARMRSATAQAHAGEVSQTQKISLSYTLICFLGILQGRRQVQQRNQDREGKDQEGVRCWLHKVRPAAQESRQGVHEGWW